MTDGRKKNGGARKGAGRKSKAEELGLAALLDRCWTQADREECLKVLADNAKLGDMDSIKLLMAYAYGKPVERKEHSGPGGAPIETTFTIQRGSVLDAGDSSDS